MNSGRIMNGTLDLAAASLGATGYSLFIPAGLRPTVEGEKADALPLAGMPLATLEGEGSFRKQLAALARKHRLRLNVVMECSSFPLVARALQTGAAAAILPSMAAVEFERSNVVELKPACFRGLTRELSLAWNPRVVSI